MIARVLFLPSSPPPPAASRPAGDILLVDPDRIPPKLPVCRGENLPPGVINPELPAAAKAPARSLAADADHQPSVFLLSPGLRRRLCPLRLYLSPPLVICPETCFLSVSAYIHHRESVSQEVAAK